MHVYVCVRCVQPLAKKSRPLSRNPNICAPCSSLADGLDMTKEAETARRTLAPLGSPYVSVPVGGDGILRPHETKTVSLQFTDPSGAAIDYNARVLDVTPAP